MIGLAGRRITAALTLCLWLVPASAPAAPSEVQHVRRARTSEKSAPASPPSAPATGSAQAPGSDTAPAPYDPELLRLSQIIGALAFLRDLCGDDDGAAWRGKMTSLLQGVGDSQLRRERMAGAFNKGFRDYELMYRSCTPNARLVISNYLREGEQLTSDVESRFGGS